jgi:hypothetical protein
VAENMGIKNFIKKWRISSLKVKALFIEAEYRPNASENQVKSKKKLFQLGYIYGQYCVTETEARNAICKQISSFWVAAVDNPPSQTMPKHLKTLSGPSLIGELAAFLKRSLNESGISEINTNLCLFGFMLFCQPLARGSETTELAVNYSKAAPISVEERQQLRCDCMANDLGTKDGAMKFFNKWTCLVEERL